MRHLERMGAPEGQTMLGGALPAELHAGIQTKCAHCNGADVDESVLSPYCSEMSFLDLSYHAGVAVSCYCFVQLNQINTGIR